MSATPTSTENPSTSKPANLSLNKQIILDEDEYTEGLSRIIARDFFPTLHHLTATNDYLTALDSQDPSLINASVRTLRELGATPVFRPGETPLRTPARNRNVSEGGPNKRRKYDDDMSLDDFQARYTSEDNASFTEILDDENRKRREKFKWAWDAQRKAMEGKMIEDTKRERMLIEGGGESDQRGIGVRPGVRGRIAIEKPDVLLITQGESQVNSEEPEPEEPNGEAKNQEMIRAEKPGSSSASIEKQDVMKPSKDTRTPFVSTWKFKNRNGFMFAPDADESPYHMPLTVSASSDTTNPNGGVRQPKSISYTSTRLPSPPPEPNDDPSNIIPPSPTRSRIDAAIAGVPYISTKELEAEGPNGYNYVPTLPSPSPDQLGPAALKELMTMGTLLSTPRLLSSTRDGDPAEEFEPTPFKINPPSRREQTGLRLSAKAGKSLREKAALLAGNTRTPRTKGDMAPPSNVGFTPKRTANDLTPAARALLARTTAGKGGGNATPLRSGGGGVFGSTGSSPVERDLGKVKWTPSPMTRR